MADVDSPRLSTAGNAWHGALQAGERARSAADRAAEPGRRRAALHGETEAVPSDDGTSRKAPEHSQRAAARAGEARVNSAQARDRAILSFLGTADRHERAADTLEARGTGKDAVVLRRQAAEYRSAALTYRRLAERMRASPGETG